MGAAVNDGEKHPLLCAGGDGREHREADGVSFALRPPSDWNAARERAAVVREYLALDKRTASSADDFAERLGLSRSRFYGLVKAFRETDAGLLRGHAGLGSKRLDPRVEEVIAGAVAACGDCASLTTVNKAVEALCGLRGLVPPSSAAVRRRMPVQKVAGPNKPRSERDHHIVLDEADLRLAVRGRSGGLVTPTLTVIIDSAGGRALGHYLSIDPDERVRASAALADALTTADAGLPGHNSNPENVLQVRNLLAGRPRERGAAIRSLFGLRLGSIILRPRKRGSVMGHGRTGEIDLELARAAVRRLVAGHNDRREPAELSSFNLLHLLAGGNTVQP